MAKAIRYSRRLAPVNNNKTEGNSDYVDNTNA